MSRPSRPELAAWLVGALDPDRSDDIAALVARDPELQAEAASLRAQIADERPGSEDAWLLPPPGLRLPGAPGLVSTRTGLLGGREAIRTGARFEVELEPPADVWANRLVVLTRQQGDWEVVFPTDPADDLPVGDLLGKGGRLRVGLTAGEQPGPQRWALAFVPLTVAIDWTDAGPSRWRALQAALEAGAGAVVIEREVGQDR